MHNVSDGMIGGFMPNPTCVYPPFGFLYVAMCVILIILSAVIVYKYYSKNGSFPSYIKLGALFVFPIIVSCCMASACVIDSGKIAGVCMSILITCFASSMVAGMVSDYTIL